MGALLVPAADLTAWADRMGATHFLTLTAGCYPDRPFDPDISFKPYLGRLARCIGRELQGLPRRRAVTLADLPPFVGFYEPTTAGGVPYPHLHGWISLGPNQEDHLRAILRTFWGQDSQPELTSPYLRHWPSSVVARRAVCKQPGWRPTSTFNPSTLAALPPTAASVTPRPA